MPEGDSVYLAAAALRPRLVGRELRRLATRGDHEREVQGAVVTAITTHGKHLLLDTDAGFGVRVHLGLKGKWHRYTPGRRWQLPAHEASLVLETERDVLVCFRAKDVELRRGPARFSPALERVGPDLLADAPNYAEILRRARATSPGRLLLDVLLDQWIAGGIGNVYKSELLYRASHSVSATLGEVGDAALRALFVDAALLLRANSLEVPRVTRESRRPGESRYEVYMRAHRSCFRCEQPIQRALLGDPPRVTFWCPSCQA